MECPREPRVERDVSDDMDQRTICASRRRRQSRLRVMASPRLRSFRPPSILWMSILWTVTLESLILRQDSATVAAFSFGPSTIYSSNSNSNNHQRLSRATTAAATSSSLHSNNNPFQFEPSPDLARALGVADPDHPRPPKTPPPEELMSHTGAAEHTAATVPFFLLDRHDQSAAAATNPQPDEIQLRVNDHDDADNDHDAGDSIVDVTAQLDDDDSFASWTVVKLKAECRRRGLKVSGKKALLVERLEESLRNQVTQTVVPSSTSVSTTTTQAAWSSMLDPLWQARFQKGVDAETIQGAVVAGATLTAVASKSVAVTSVVGLLAAYTAITEGQAGQWTRQVGRVVWDAVVAATQAAKQQVQENNINIGQESYPAASASQQTMLGQSLSLMGSLVNKTISSVESGMAAASLAQAEAHDDVRDNDDGTIITAVDNVAASSRSKIMQQPQPQTKETTAFLQNLMAKRFAYDATTRANRQVEAVAAAKQRQTAFLQKMMAVRFEVQAKEKAAWLEEVARQEEAARVAEENERLKLTKLIEERTRMEAEAREIAADAAARMVAEAVPEMVEAAKAIAAEEAGRMITDATNVIADEAKELGSVEAMRMAVEAAPKILEEVKTVAADEAVRVVNDALPDMEDEISEEDWMESIRVAQKSIEGKMAGYDFEDEYVNEEEKENWNKAEKLAQQLGNDEIDDFTEDIDMKNSDTNVVEDAARVVMEELGTTRDQNDAAMEVSDWSSLNFTKLRSMCKARGLSTLGKKTELVARLEEASASNTAAEKAAQDDLDDFDLDSIDLTAVGDAARAAVEEYERMRDPETDEGKPADLESLTVAQLREECQLQGLSTTGKKADLIARLQMDFVTDTADDLDDLDLDNFDISAVGDAARAAVEEYERMRDGGARVNSFSNDDAAAGALGAAVVDWNTLSVKELQQELLNRDLPTNGPKADLVAALEAYTDTDSYLDESDLESDLEELALRYGSKTDVDKEDDDSDADDDDLDLDIDFDSLDLDAMGQAARQAVDMFSVGQADEPSDEDLWEIESLNLPDDDDDEDDDEDMDAATRGVNGAASPLDASSIVYAKMTVTELKDELRNRGLSVTGKKADLIDRLVEFDVVR